MMAATALNTGARRGARRAISVRLPPPRPSQGIVVNVPNASLTNLVVVAQEGAEDPYGFLRMLFPLLMMLLFFYLLLIRPQKKKEEDLRRQIDRLKENDRVVTVGGIYGTVTNIRKDADMLTIRVDESTGTKIRVGRSAVARVLSDEHADDTESKLKK